MYILSCTWMTISSAHGQALTLLLLAHIAGPQLPSIILYNVKSSSAWGTIALLKSILDPTQCLMWLGMWVDSLRHMFRLPDLNMGEIRASATANPIVTTLAVSIVTLQKLMGKCILYPLLCVSLELSSISAL